MRLLRAQGHDPVVKRTFWILILVILAGIVAWCELIFLVTWFVGNDNRFVWLTYNFMLIYFFIFSCVHFVPSGLPKEKPAEEGDAGKVGEA